MQLFAEPTSGFAVFDVYKYCPNLIDGWGKGKSACFSEEYGIRVGRHGYKTVIMILHWKNPLKLVGETDSSGLRWYLSPRPRRYDTQGVIVVGPSQFELPPGQKRVSLNSTCPDECMRKAFNDSIVYISMIFTHMHELGKLMLCSANWFLQRLIIFNKICC